MTPTELHAFAQVFKAVCAKCFGRAVAQPLSEPESRHLSHEIEEQTGLVVGWKSLKNYSVFVLHPETAKPENPSAATLDTLARYLAGAPATNEARRKREGTNASFWFRYLEQYGEPDQQPPPAPPQKKRLPAIVWWGLPLALAVAVFCFLPKKQAAYSTDFQELDTSFFQKNDWLLLAKDAAYWQRRSENPGCLTLFTLTGDNWRNREQTPRIRNLLARRIENECFDAEVHFSDFIPRENWQQAGLLLLEDTTYLGKSLRLSLAFNNFFGGFDRPDEILVQGVADFGKGSPNVEEIHHHQLFSVQEADSAIVRNNLRFSALRIEKRGRQFRFLYAASPFEHFSYKELGVYDFDFQPRYVGIFAMKGFVDSAAVLPVRVRFFRLERVGCE